MSEPLLDMLNSNSIAQLNYIAVNYCFIVQVATICLSVNKDFVDRLISISFLFILTDRDSYISNSSLVCHYSFVIPLKSLYKSIRYAGKIVPRRK